MTDTNFAETGVSSDETQQKEQSVGEKQAELGKKWASVYGDTNKPMDRSAEIILRNPAVYARDLDKHNLPEDLREEWSALSKFADSLATIASTTQVDWGDSIGGIDKIQQLVFSDRVKPDFRRSIADIMKTSSDLFSRSVTIVPGNTEYFEGNIRGAENWIQKHQQASTPPIESAEKPIANPKPESPPQSIDAPNAHLSPVVPGTGTPSK